MMINWMNLSRPDRTQLRTVPSQKIDPHHLFFQFEKCSNKPVTNKQDEPIHGVN